MRKRLTAALLCFCLLFTLLPATAFAEGEPDSGPPPAQSALCAHHPQHDESCGYTEGTEGSPCSHEHTEDCYTLVTECVHEHTAECYPTESVSENTATPSEPEEAEPTACTHVCSEESGCITKALDCKHEHDEACGYVPATEGTTCTFVCEICNAQDSGNPATPSDAQPEECTCKTLCTEDNTNGDCPVCGAEGADLNDCKGLKAQPATLSNALPVTALAAAPSGQVIYVGDENVTSGGYWTTDSDGSVTPTDEDTPTDNYIHYDAENNVLTLHNATIKEALGYGTNPPHSLILGAAIGVLNQSGDAELTITLEGTNTIAEVNMGIYVLAHSQSTGSSSLTITGDGSLDASGSQSGIRVQSNSDDAALKINSAEVKAEGGTYTGCSGVLVQAKNSSNVSLTVDGGNLTASGNTGINFWFGTSISGSGTPTVTVSNSAIVRASGNAGGISDNSSADLEVGADSNGGGGIIFDNGTGTVYGDVTLQESLTIGEGESLTLDDGASLDTGDYTLKVDGGTLTGNVTGTVIYKVTSVSLNKDSLTLDVGGSETLTATITPDNATDQNVTWSSNNQNVATVENGKVTAVGAGSTTIKATVDGKSAECSVTVNAVQTYTVTLETNGGTINSGEVTSYTYGVGATLPTDVTRSGYKFAGWYDNAELNGSPVTAISTTDTGDKTYYAKWLSTDAGVASVSVNGVTGNISGEQITVTLPPNSALPDGTDDITITTAAGAAYSNLTISAGTGSVTYTFTVTAEDGTTTANYTVTVTVATDPAAGNKADVDAAKTAVENHTWTVPQTTANTEEAVKTWIEEQLAGMNLNGASYTVTMTGFTAAVKGTSADRDGTDGSFAFTVDLSKGTATGDTFTSTYAEATATVTGGVITATAYTSGGGGGGGTTTPTYTSRTLSSNGVTLSGSDIHRSAHLTATEGGLHSAGSCATCDQIRAWQAEGRVIAVYDVSLSQGFRGNITITFPVPGSYNGQTLTVVHCVDGKQETHRAAVANGKISVTVDSLSPFAILDSKENPDTGFTNPFTDVNEGDWFYNDVMFVYQNGLMAGTSDTTFSPNAPITRAQAAVIFYRMAGSPEVTGDSAFTDVENGPGTAWYYNAVLWAQQNGIVAGYGDGTFHPGTNITREQLAVIFYNYAKLKGYDVSAVNDLSGFTDAGDVSDWALPAMRWAVGSGIMGGYGDGILGPQGTATRAQVAAMLRRFIENNKLVPPAVLPGGDSGTTGTGGTGSGGGGWTQQVTSPQTGDSSNIGLWFSLMLLSLSGIVALLVTEKVRRRRMEDEEAPHPMIV